MDKILTWFNDKCNGQDFHNHGITTNRTIQGMRPESYFEYTLERNMMEESMNDDSMTDDSYFEYMSERGMM